MAPASRAVANAWTVRSARSGVWGRRYMEHLDGEGICDEECGHGQDLFYHMSLVLLSWGCLFVSLGFLCVDEIGWF